MNLKEMDMLWWITEIVSWIAILIFTYLAVVIDCHLPLIKIIIEKSGFVLFGYIAGTFIRKVKVYTRKHIRKSKKMRPMKE